MEKETLEEKLKMIATINMLFSEMVKLKSLSNNYPVSQVYDSMVMDVILRVRGTPGGSVDKLLDMLLPAKELLNMPTKEYLK